VLPETQDVVVGDAEQLMGSEVQVTQSSWLRDVPEVPFEASVRIRYRHEPAPATITPSADGFHAVFHEAQRALTPGQAAVVYRGEEVMGGGFIA
jgi:tRNA-specific 2-thiouridylase